MKLRGDEPFPTTQQQEEEEQMDAMEMELLREKTTAAHIMIKMGIFRNKQNEKWLLKKHLLFCTKIFNKKIKNLYFT